MPTDMYIGMLEENRMDGVCVCVYMRAISPYRELTVNECYVRMVCVSAFMHEYIYVKNENICDWLRLHCHIDLCANHSTDQLTIKQKRKKKTKKKIQHYNHIE